MQRGLGKEFVVRRDEAWINRRSRRGHAAVGGIMSTLRGWGMPLCDSAHIPDGKARKATRNERSVAWAQIFMWLTQFFCLVPAKSTNRGCTVDDRSYIVITHETGDLFHLHGAAPWIGRRIVEADDHSCGWWSVSVGHKG